MLQTDLERARQWYEQGAWSEAYQLLCLTDRTRLGVDDLEMCAVSAYMTGREDEFHRFTERAHHKHLEDGHHSRAARSAFWLGLMLLLRGEMAQANGWLARAQRLVEGTDCVERGYLFLPVAELHLIERDGGAALTAAERAVGIGARFGDADLLACALHVQGRAFIVLGELTRGLDLLDETMIAVSRRELSPIMTGLLYCSVIDACEQVFARSRAREWTAALHRWCSEQPTMVAFTGICLVHRAAVMQFCGSWAEAIVEARYAYDRSVAVGDRRMQAAAFYQQGEIYRLRGDYSAAEGAYRNASRLGYEPQPGLALLRMAQGRVDAAAAALHRILSSASDGLERAKLLPAYVDVALGNDDMDQALSASTELDEIARRLPTDVLQAMAAQARGSVELARGHPTQAVGSLRRALGLWQQCEAPYETARVRQLIALSCRELGDIESANLEFEAAASLFERLGATPDLAHLHALRKHSTKNRFGLTPREIEVLRHIATGKTNKAIATALLVSERTIDRHVGNILTKLGVPSRAAATATASNQRLL